MISAAAETFTHILVAVVWIAGAIAVLSGLSKEKRP